MGPSPAKRMGSTVGNTEIHSSDGSMKKINQTDKKQLPYLPQRPLEAQLLNRCIMQKDEAYFLRKVMCVYPYLIDFRDRHPVWDEGPGVWERYNK